MSPWLPALCAATATALLLANPEPRLERIRRGRDAVDPVAGPIAAAAGLAATALILLMPMPWGIPAAILAVRGLIWASRRLAGPPAGPDLVDLALGLEVTAATIAAGAAMPAGLAAAGETVPVPVGPAFAVAAIAARQGADPGDALLAGLPGLAASAAGVLRRSGITGAAVSGPLLAAAAELRGEADHLAEARVQAAAVRLVLPIGLCFLPAFVLVGVVPVVAGLGGRLW